jgi:hypothetical protein
MELCYEDGLQLYIPIIWSKKIEYFIGKLIEFGAENDAAWDEVGDHIFRRAAAKQSTSS